MTYAQALKRPCGPGGRGWKYADETSMLAAACEHCALFHAINPGELFKAAKRQRLKHREVFALSTDVRKLLDVLFA